MKNYTFFLCCLIGLFTAQADCTNAYSSASYGLAHAKKSLSSNNFDHQRYYAERALTAFEKTESLAANCGCEASGEPIWQGMDNLKKAIDPKDWEMGRYYTKKALANAQDLMAALDRCTSGEDTILPELPQETNTTASDDLKNPEELRAQLDLKRLAEITMFEVEKSIRELAATLGCTESFDLVENIAERSEEQIKEESFDATRQFYLAQSMALQKQALKALADCAGYADEEALNSSNP